jgi:hypothetical protein
MSDVHPIRTARRKKRQQEREDFGIAVSPCILCIEAHHTAGKHHDAHLTAPLCQKHHREMHEQMLRGNISLTFEHNKQKRVANALRATVVYDRARADAMERWAEAIDESEGKQNE